MPISVYIYVNISTGMNLVDFLAIVPFYVEVVAKAVTADGSPGNGALTVSL